MVVLEDHVDDAAQQFAGASVGSMTRNTGNRNPHGLIARCRSYERESSAEQNFKIAEAKATLAEYTRTLGQKGEMRLRMDDINAFRLAQKSPIDSSRLKQIKASIDQQTGGALLQTAGKASSGGYLGDDSSVFDSLLTSP